MARSASREIHALSPKLDVMADVLYDLSKLSAKNLKELASFCGVNYDALKAARAKGRLSYPVEERLCTGLGFPQMKLPGSMRALSLPGAAMR